jgi:hypothetical protein
MCARIESSVRSDMIQDLSLGTKLGSLVETKVYKRDAPMAA